MPPLTLHAQRELLMRPLSGTAAGSAVTLHLSAASGLVRRGSRHYVVADDEHHLAVFDAPGPGDWVRLFDGELPAARAAAPARRKRVKPDLETLLDLPPSAAHPDGALLALGSGSRPNRQRGVLLPYATGLHGLGPPRSIDLTALYAPLRRECADLNIEGGAVCGGEFRLLQRANRGSAANLSIRFAWSDVQAWLNGSRAAPLPLAFERFELGQLDGVPLGFTDATPLPGGGWAFSAAAEATDDSYHDGACTGSVVGIVDAGGILVHMQRIPGRWKVEGIAAAPAGGGALEWTLVTDADDRTRASTLLTVEGDVAPR